MKHERGNILFLILLAVVLFAALSYAVTNSMRGGGKNAAAETAKSDVAALQNYGVGMRTALLRMTLASGYQPWQIDYEPYSGSTTTANATCTTDACRLFKPSGGGMAPFPTPKWANGATLDYTFHNFPVGNTGSDRSELLMAIRVDNDSSFCLAVNNEMGIVPTNPNADGVPIDGAIENYWGVYDYTGTLTQDVDTSESGGYVGQEDTALMGKQMFCAYLMGLDSTHIFYVLIER